MNVIEHARSWLEANSWIEGAYEATRALDRMPLALIEQALLLLAMDLVIRPIRGEHIRAFPDSAELHLVILYLFNGLLHHDEAFRRDIFYPHNIWRGVHFHYVDDTLIAQSFALS